jgi:hypothetical protein
LSFSEEDSGTGTSAVAVPTTEKEKGCGLASTDSLPHER